ncbi:MAG: hypothetical protein HY900_08615 [Deltaproteobacteria bacterium]|nr:hypothetical protein [Deltaproteobacteria bacterium]
MDDMPLHADTAGRREALSELGHRLRTPLTSIRSFSEIMLCYDVPEPEKRLSFLRIIHAEAERLAREIDDLLDLRRHGLDDGEDLASPATP